MPPRLRVGFDGRALVSPAGGVRRYTRALFGAMAGLAHSPEVIAIGAPPGLELPPGVVAGPAPPPAPTNLGWTLCSIPIGCRRAGVDVYHAPAYTCPWWGMPPAVVTIHDCSYERRPEWYPHRRGPWRRWFYRRSAEAANVVVTDSEFSKREILAAFDIAPERVVVVSLAADDVFRPGSTGAPGGTRPPYLLHVGDLHPRRDMATAVAALARARQRAGCEALRLLLIGVDRDRRGALDQLAAAAGVAHVVEHRHDVADAELVTLYRGAVALLYTSRYEGFGLPLVEAMACGTPVVAADAGPTPEVVATAATLIEPGDADGFAEAIHRLVVDATHREAQARAGIARASAFSWRRAAEETVDVYRAMAPASAGRPGTAAAGRPSRSSGDVGGPAVSVIVVNYNGREHLTRCLNALACQTLAHEVVVVDNGSEDDSCAMVRREYPTVRLIPLERNVGFAAANNVGAAAARGRCLAFLNNDTEPAPEWLEALRDGLGADPAVGFATSRIVYLDDPSTVDSAGDVVTRWGGAFKRAHGAAAASVSEPGDVFAACGAACLFRREVFEEVGGFDDAFFLVFEDVDLSYRAQLRGYRCHYVPGAVVGHAGSATLGRVSPTAVYYGQRNLEWLYLKNTPGAVLACTLPGHVLYVAAGAVYYASQGALGPYARAKWAALKGVTRVWRQRRAIQRSRRLTAREVWERLERRWLVRKIYEKRFDLGLARQP